jgi:hypothetical protein
MTTETFSSWALIELFGHNRLAGKCTEQSIAGTNFLRVDVPETNRNPAFTRFLNHSAIYAINPMTEEMARSLAEGVGAQPVQAWDMRAFQEKQKALVSAGETERSQVNAEQDEEEEEEQYDER